jgi:hypothetical protein
VTVALSGAELKAQQSTTAAFIAADPTELVLTPHEKVAGTGGTYRLVPRPARAAQLFKVIWLSDRDRPLVTVDGKETRADIMLLGSHLAVADARDKFGLPDGRTVELIASQPGYGYQVKWLGVLRG